MGDSGAPNHISCQREDADEGPRRAPSLLLVDVIGGGSIGQNMRRSEATERTRCSSLSQSISYHFVYWLFGGLTLLLSIRKSERLETVQVMSFIVAVSSNLRKRRLVGTTL